VVEHGRAFLCGGARGVAGGACRVMSCICQPSLPLGVIERNLFSAASCSVMELKLRNWSRRT